jgi:hypothetical protein
MLRNRARRQLAFLEQLGLIFTNVFRTQTKPKSFLSTQRPQITGQTALDPKQPRANMNTNGFDLPTSRGT